MISSTRTLTAPMVLLGQTSTRAARNNSTTTSSSIISPHRRKQAVSWLLADTRHHVGDLLTSPALDCADLAERLRSNADAAYADLARLDLVQLTLQVVCYAAYANELLRLELRGDDVLAS